MKRGQIALKPVIEIVIVAVVVLSFFSFARDYATKDVHARARLSREGALLIDTFYDIEGNAFVTYPSDVSAYDILLQEQSLVLTQENQKSSNLFAPAEGLVPNTLSNEQYVTFYKNGDTVSIAEKAPDINQFRCGKKVDYRSRSRQVQVTKETQKIADSLVLDCTSESLCVAESAALKENDIYVKIIFMERAGVAARYTSEESKAIACNFINEVLKQKPDMDTWLLPTDDSELTSKKTPFIIEVNTKNIDIVGVALQQLLGVI